MTRFHRIFAFTSAFLTVAQCAFAREAGDVVLSQVERLDGEKLVERRAFGAEASTGVERAVQKIDVNLKSAEKSLSEGRTGDQTRTAQRVVVEELQKLIAAAKAQQTDQATSPSDSFGQPQQAGTNTPQSAQTDPGHDAEAITTEQAGESNSQTATSAESKAAESSDRTASERRFSGIVRDFRADVVRDVWGHLPPRLRDQLLNSGSDKYLPQYDSLVRSYFEALAGPGAANSRNVGTDVRPTADDTDR